MANLAAEIGIRHRVAFVDTERLWVRVDEESTCFLDTEPKEGSLRDGVPGLGGTTRSF